VGCGASVGVGGGCVVGGGVWGGGGGWGREEGKEEREIEKSEIYCYPARLFIGSVQ